MPELFSPSEVIQFAITIEKNGEEFYREAAQRMDTKAVKDLFGFLADEEVKHGRLFQKFLAEVQDYTPPETFAGEYLAYLGAYTKDFIFTQEKKGALAARKMEGVKDAIEFALGVEVDSILYYIEAKNFVPEPQRKAIDKIIEEERRHYLSISALIKDS